METHFTNVHIAILAATPEEAYTKLCNALGTDLSIEWKTDLYWTEKNTNPRQTSSLFPKG